MIYAYTKYIDDLRTVELRVPHGLESTDLSSHELATVDGITYVYVADNITLPEQPPEIDPKPVTLTPELREAIKRESPWCWLVTDRMQEQIRARYSQEDEHYLTRISVGVLSGIYTYEPGEEQQVLEFGQFVESVRAWGRAERAKVGL